MSDHITNASAATYTASAITVVSGLSLTEWLAIGGFVMGLLTFAVNLYFQHKNFQLNKEQAAKQDESD